MRRTRFGRIAMFAVLAVMTSLVVTATPAAAAGTYQIRSEALFAVQPAVAAAARDEPVARAAWDDRTGESLRAWECDWGNVCFWPEYNGAGARCMWSVDDPYWTSGSITCSWAANWNVRSVMNMKPANSGGGIGVIYYKKSDYNDRAGCTRPEHGGNLAGTYQLRSHRWMPSGSCG